MGRKAGERIDVGDTDAQMLIAQDPRGSCPLSLARTRLRKIRKMREIVLPVFLPPWGGERWPVGKWAAGRGPPGIAALR